MPDFDYIVFDSQPLRESCWPTISQTLGGLFRLSGRFHLSLFIPEPVELELEEQWIRRLGDFSDNVTESLRKLNDMYRLVEVQPVNLQFANSNDLINGYRRRVADAKNEWNIQNIPLTRRQLNSVLGMSLLRTPPFKEIGKNKEVAGV